MHMLKDISYNIKSKKFYIFIAVSLKETAREIIEIPNHRLDIMALLGAIGFPVYYFIWVYVFPENYENMFVRIIGAGLCSLCMTKRFWPVKWQNKYFVPLFVITAIYSLPFFFFFMAIMNQLTLNSSMSLLAGYFVLFTMANWITALLIMAAGFTFALVAILVLYGGQYFSPEIIKQLVEFIPIFIFSWTFGIFYNRNRYNVIREKVQTVNKHANIMYHEVLRPIEGMNTIINRMISEAKRTKSPLLALSKEVHFECQNSINLIHLLQSTSYPQKFKKMADMKSELSINDVIISALLKYPFSDEEHLSVKWDLGTDFQIVSSKTLCVYSIANLLKNAFKAKFRKGYGEIFISTEKGKNFNTVTIKDTAGGIPRKHIKKIFRAFYTTNQPGEGMGLGLAFVKEYIQSQGGSIECESDYESFTIMRLNFPS